MSAKNFKVITHPIPGQHICEYLNSTAYSLEDVLRIEVKQYVPFGQGPQPEDMTIIAAHANGLWKALYEPLWDTILQNLRSSGLGIRGIWIADISTQGGSSVLNEVLGNEMHWFEHSRDLLRMGDVFCSEMPAPLVGI
jgi:hypothetical protein